MTASLGSILMREMGGGTKTTPQNKKALLPQNEQHLLFLDGTQSIRGFRAKVKMPQVDTDLPSVSLQLHPTLVV